MSDCEFPAGPAILPDPTIIGVPQNCYEYLVQTITLPSNVGGTCGNVVPAPFSIPNIPIGQRYGITGWTQLSACVSISSMQFPYQPNEEFIFGNWTPDPGICPDGFTTVSPPTCCSPFLPTDMPPTPPAWCVNYAGGAATGTWVFVSESLFSNPPPCYSYVSLIQQSSMYGDIASGVASMLTANAVPYGPDLETINPATGVSIAQSGLVWYASTVAGLFQNIAAGSIQLIWEVHYTVTIPEDGVGNPPPPHGGGGGGPGDGHGTPNPNGLPGANMWMLADSNGINFYASGTEFFRQDWSGSPILPCAAIPGHRFVMDVSLRRLACVGELPAGPGTQIWYSEDHGYSWEDPVAIVGLENGQQSDISIAPNGTIMILALVVDDSYTTPMPLDFPPNMPGGNGNPGSMFWSDSQKWGHIHMALWPLGEPHPLAQVTLMDPSGNPWVFPSGYTFHAELGRHDTGLYYLFCWPGNYSGPVILVSSDTGLTWDLEPGIKGM